MSFDLSRSKPLSWFVPGKTVHVHDSMQKDYTYILSKPKGKRSFPKHFNPELTPLQMLKMGVFEGKYLNDCIHEFPKEWFQAMERCKTTVYSNGRPDETRNYFKVKSRQSLRTWRVKKWIKSDDPDVRGWFQWYCRYWLGRRDEKRDEIQIKRFRAFTRHRGQIVADLKRKKMKGVFIKTKKDKMCHRSRQRQALLQWAYNPMI